MFIPAVSCSPLVSSISVPIKLYAPNGRSLQLTWTAVKGQPRLSKITGDSEDLLEIKYRDPRVEIVHARGAEDPTTFTILQQELDGITCINRVQGSAGLVEKLTYKAQGFKVPKGGPYSTLPTVSQHVLDPGNQQPAIRTIYSFSEKSFLGYDGVDQWKVNEDILYRVRDDYRYTSKVSTDGGRTITNTYNKFHLVLKTVQEQSGKQMETVNTYYAKQDVPLEFQPPQFQLPLRMQTTCRDLANPASTRVEETQYTFDEWRNPTLDIRPDGLKTERVYYPPGGESKKCPADPHGFQRHLKLQTITPPKKRDPAPVRATLHTYLEMRTATDAPTDKMILAAFSQSLEDNIPNYSISWTYVDKPDGRDHGRHLEQTSTMLDTFPMVKSWLYEYSEADQMTETSPSTSFEATKKFDYSVAGETGGTTLTTTEVNGLKIRSITDGLRRVCQIEKQGDDGKWNADGSYTGTSRVVEQMTYNELGQCSQKVETDWLRDKDGPKKQNLSYDYKYDDWGSVCQVISSNGVTTSKIKDPIAQTYTEGIVGQGKKRAQFEPLNTLIQSALLKKDDTLYSHVDYSNDGLGRKAQQTDSLGYVTRYGYDSFHRVKETTWPNKNVIKTQYMGHSADALTESIQVQDITLGKQDFDGLGRTKTQKVGSREILLSYKGVSPKPSDIATPKKKQAQINYEPALGYAVISLKSDDNPRSYKYDPHTSNMLQSNNPYYSEILKHFPSGIAVGILTAGAGFAVEAGLGTAAGVAADVVTGLTYDAATGKSPSWKSVGSDALYGAIGGVTGKVGGRLLSKGINHLVDLALWPWGQRL
ncbi:YD repeat-containing protein [Fusarium beomiforme]|uniref:YD repeat-containing protein n=1 Tax=Fusarium beomiforme TaxID=44412 RepID=A0A9P5DQ56_9HYPO|nr:YD repeat-containing protein [Fusarium beomiforme]